MLVKFLTYDIVEQYHISKSAVFHKYQHNCSSVFEIE